MPQTHKAPERAVEKRATSNGSGDVSSGAGEELAALRVIAEGTAHSIGEEFFHNLVRHLARSLGVSYAFVAEFASPESTTKARTIAFWAKDHIAENFEWTLAGTPCEEVVHGKLCHYPSGVRRSFPNDRSSAERRIESYLGVPLYNPDGKILGHLAVFDERPMPAEPRNLLTFRIFATRAAAELERLQYEERLRASEQRWRSLTEELRQVNTRLDLAVRGSNVGVWDLKLPDGDYHRRQRHYVNLWEQLGYDGPPVGRDSALDEADPDDRARLEETVRRYLAGETSEFETEIRLRHKDGSYHPMLARGAAVRDAAGKPIRMVGVIIDITDLKRVEEALRESEERLRDLYEEAPIAYVKEDLESRFISANRAAQRILGIKPEEVPGIVGLSLVSDRPDAQRVARDHLALQVRGEETRGVVVELRRKDDGKPVWIEIWAKPEPGGKYTRTMFLDVTDRVLMEQEKARLAAENIYLQEEIKSVHNFEQIVGRSPALLEALEKVNRVAKTDATVIVTGETGTGKELIARAIHSASPRHDKPLIKLNCAALPAGLVESELFGHEKGAFSGAITRRVGRFELANGGTIFLDEVGEVPLDVQVKLLRVLQEREFERVGGTNPIKVDVRVIAATNRDLGKSIHDGKFREDLYYRLNVFPIPLPPLRDRSGDVPLLVHFLVARFAARIGVRIESVGKATMERLSRYSWPGNIRELENVLERAVILSNGPTLEIDPEVFASPTAERAPGAEPLAAASAGQPPPIETLESTMRSHILAALEKSGWVIDGPRGAATILGLHPNTLRSRMKKLAIVRARSSGARADATGSAPTT